MRITVLSRGGLAVYGGHYDPHRNEVILQARDTETAAITVEYPSAPTTPAVTPSGATTTDPTISGNKVSFTLSGINDGAQVDLSATVGGETKVVRIRGRSQTWVDRYYCSGGRL